jgi:glycosyltransferase involved in cell wall biosynthesis
VSVPVLELLVSTRPGGGPEHVRTLARGLVAHGFRPIVAGPRDGAMFDTFAADGFETLVATTNAFAPRTFVELSRFVRARAIQLVHSHGKGAGLYGRLVARACGIPAIHSFHGLHFERYRGPARSLYLALERTLARSTALIVNVSAAQQAEGLALRLYGAQQARVVPNGIDVAALQTAAMTRAQARTSVGVDQGAFVVGCAARFDPVKGLDLVLRAVATVDGVTLVLIGDGPEAPRVAALAAPLGARVIRTGEVNGAARLFPGFDVYAAPSAKEGMPLAVLEAIALGVPVVASDIPAHREVLGADYPALLPRTPEAFATGLRRTVTDAVWRRSLAAQGLARAGRFDAARMVEAIARLYREALAGGGVGGRPVHLPVVG